DAEATCVEKGLVLPGDAVDHATEADGIVRPAPSLARQLEPYGDGLIDVREFVGLDIAPGQPSAGEEAQVRGELLLQVEADPGAAAIVAHRGNVRGLPRQLCQPYGILEATHASASQEAGDCELAGLPSKLITPLDLADPLHLLEPGVQLGTVGHDREIEQAGAQRPAALVPFRCRVGGEPHGIGGVVE